MSVNDTELPLPANWVIEEALKVFNAHLVGRPITGPATVAEVKENRTVGYAASIIAHARLIEKFQPELRLESANEVLQDSLGLLFQHHNQDYPYWDGTVNYAQHIQKYLADRGFVIVKKESAQ